MKPFIEHCALAPLPGEGSFAGSILSHDFVEAALMRRAGWGSGLPTISRVLMKNYRLTLFDELKRDRRWCHGNLMNFRLFPGEGYAPGSPCGVPDGRDVLSLRSSCGLCSSRSLLHLQVVHALTEPQYFLQPRQLFPVWPQWRPELAIALLLRLWCCCSCRSY